MYINKEQKELVLYRKAQTILKWMRSEHSTILTKTILSDLIAIVDSLDDNILFSENDDEDNCEYGEWFNDFKKIVGLTRNDNITRPTYIMNNLGIIFQYKPNYRKRCDELDNITFIDANKYTLGYSIKRFLEELKWANMWCE